MDYKGLAERLKYYGTTYAIGDNLGREITGTDELMLNAAESITELLTENQALRNAANGFKKQAEAAEARAEKAARERDAAIKMLRKIEWCNGCKNFRGLQGCRIGDLVTCNPQNDMYVFGEGEE